MNVMIRAVDISFICITKFLDSHLNIFYSLELFEILQIYLDQPATDQKISGCSHEIFDDRIRLAPPWIRIFFEPIVRTPVWHATQLIPTHFFSPDDSGSVSGFSSTPNPIGKFSLESFIFINPYAPIFFTSSLFGVSLFLNQQNELQTFVYVVNKFFGIASQPWLN